MIYALIALVSLQVLDFYTTCKIIKSGGRELNPIVNKLIKNFGLIGGLALSKLVVVALGLAMFNKQSNLIYLLVSVYVIVVCNNTYQYCKDKGV